MRTKIVNWLLAVVSLTLAGVMPASAEAEGHYKVMPGDALAVKVFQYDDLSGKYAIDAAGSITMPVVGEIKLGGQTLEACQNTIKAALTRGYLVNPVVSVRIEEYRPLYIYGQVKAPGVYAYRTGMSAMSAIVVAGGLPIFESSALVANSDLVTADERVSVLSARRLELLVNIAGLKAQSLDRPEFDLTALPAEVAISPSLDELAKSERNRMSMAFAARNSEVALLSQQKPQLENERKLLDGELVAQSRLVQQLARHRLELQDLVKTGLGHAVTVYEIEQLLASAESTVARLKSTIAHNEVERSALDLHVIERQNLFKQQAVQQLSDASRGVTQTEIELASALKARDLRRQAAGISGTVATNNSFVIYRTVDGQQQVIKSAAAANIEPGDIIEVRSVEDKVTSAAAPAILPPHGSPAAYTPNRTNSKDPANLNSNLGQ